MIIRKYRLLRPAWIATLQGVFWAGLVAALPWAAFNSIRFTGIFTVCLIAMGILGSDWREAKTRLLENRLALLPWALLFLWQLVGVAWTIDPAEGWHLISVRLGLLWIPVIWTIQPVPDASKKLVAWASGFSLLTVFVMTQRGGLVWFQDCPVCYTDVYGPTPKPYLPIMAVVSVVLLLQAGSGRAVRYEAAKRSSFLVPEHYLAAVLALLTMVSYAKMGAIALLLGSVLGTFAMVRSLVVRKAVATLAAVLLVLGPMALVKVFSGPNSLGPLGPETPWWVNVSVNSRLLIWEVVSKTIAEGHIWLTGVGTGGFRTILKERYCQVSIEACMINFNPHNQYLEQWLQGGLVGLLAFSGFLSWLLWIAFKIRNAVAVFAIASASVMLITECMLSRELGVLAVTVAIFFSLNKGSKQA